MRILPAGVSERTQCAPQLLRVGFLEKLTNELWEGMVQLNKSVAATAQAMQSKVSSPPHAYYHTHTAHTHHVRAHTTITRVTQFVAEAGTFTLTCTPSGSNLRLKPSAQTFDLICNGFCLTDGGLDAFFGGLENLVGPPNPNLEEQLEREHTAMADSTMLFRTTNYGIDTRPDLEFYCAPYHRLHSLPPPLAPTA